MTHLRQLLGSLLLAAAAALVITACSTDPPGPAAADQAVRPAPPPAPMLQWPPTEPLSPELRAAWEAGIAREKAEAEEPAAVADRCTNQIDYTGDPRSNAEINSLGTPEAGTCPEPLSGLNAELYYEGDDPGRAIKPEPEYNPPNYLGDPNDPDRTEDGYGSEWTKDQACAAEGISPEDC